jgi:N-acetylmuramoyl-L-alanine amidase
VRTSLLFAILFLLFAAALILPSGSGQATEHQEPPAQNPPAPLATPQPQPPPPAPPTPVKPTLSVVVLDAAHGGADAGARGPSGVLESEVVLGFANQIRAELERQGLRVVLTRQRNENPSFDDRSTVANGQRGAAFISLHVSSTGRVGTARAFSIAPLTSSTRQPASAGAERAGLTPWDQAQATYAALSRRLAELVQVQLAQKFRGSPDVPILAPVRQLRTVAAPAIAIEISSVSVSSRSQLEQMAPALAEAVARSVAAFRPLYQAEAK